MGRILEYLDRSGLTNSTLVVYTADQGFFLGDHGWYDKRFMYEESLRMPFVLRFPREVPAGTVNSDMVLNVDFASLFLDLAGIAHETVKGGDNETDAGFQGLMREATKDSPDVLVSLYDDAGCVGAIRARVSLALDLPTISTPIWGR